MLKLDINNELLITEAKAAIEQAIASAPVPVAVTKRISAFAVRHRNRGRDAAIRHHQFEGMCEASSKPLHRRNTHLDELELGLGYAGKVRWVCPRVNNSGTFSFGGCAAPNKAFEPTFLRPPG